MPASHTADPYLVVAILPGASAPVVIATGSTRASRALRLAARLAPHYAPATVAIVRASELEDADHAQR